MEAIAHEAMIVNGPVLMYFGPFPALLRVPLNFIYPTGYGKYRGSQDFPLRLSRCLLLPDLCAWRCARPRFHLTYVIGSRIRASRDSRLARPCFCYWEIFRFTTKLLSGDWLYRLPRFFLDCVRDTPKVVAGLAHYWDFHFSPVARYSPGSRSVRLTSYSRYFFYLA